jgi:hypothetical protein
MDKVRKQQVTYFPKRFCSERYPILLGNLRMLTGGITVDVDAVSL